MEGKSWSGHLGAPAWFPARRPTRQHRAVCRDVGLGVLQPEQETFSSRPFTSGQFFDHALPARVKHGLSLTPWGRGAECIALRLRLLHTATHGSTELSWPKDGHSEKSSQGGNEKVGARAGPAWLWERSFPYPPSHPPRNDGCVLRPHTPVRQRGEPARRCGARRQSAPSNRRTYVTFAPCCEERK
jgi:hypothetical protein